MFNVPGLINKNRKCEQTWEWVLLAVDSVLALLNAHKCCFSIQEIFLCMLSAERLAVENTFLLNVTKISNTKLSWLKRENDRVLSVTAYPCKNWKFRQTFLLTLYNLLCLRSGMYLFAGKWFAIQMSTFITYHSKHIASLQRFEHGYIHNLLCVLCTGGIVPCNDHREVTTQQFLIFLVYCSCNRCRVYKIARHKKCMYINYFIVKLKGSIFNFNFNFISVKRHIKQKIKPYGGLDWKANKACK